MKIPWQSLLITGIILYLAATRLDWVALSHAILSIDPLYLALALGMWVLIIVIKSLKWSRIVSVLGGGLSLVESARMLLVGLFVGVITPGRVGDFVRAAYLKDQIGLGKGIMAVFVDRALDVLILMVLAGIGIVNLFRATGIQLISDELLAGLFIAFFLALFLALNRRVAKTIWKRLIRFLPVSLSGKATEYGRQFYDSIPALRKKPGSLLLASILGIVSWLLSVSFGYFLLQGAGIPLEWGVALLTIPVLALVEIIPLGIAGIGTRELAAVIVLGAYGVPPEHAIVFSLLYFAVGYIPSFLMGAVAFNQHPIDFKGGMNLFSGEKK